jgi:quinoprotein glucose dehydrogenase
VKGYRMGALYAPPSLAEAPDGTRGTIILPGFTGRGAVGARRCRPETGLIYIGSATQPSLGRAREERHTDLDYVAARGAPSVHGIPITKPPYGRITAIDLKTGTIAWQVSTATHRRHMRTTRC